jgi:hypothetical protein
LTLTKFSAIHPVIKRAGYRTIAMTASLYAHASPEEDRRVSGTLQRALKG